jgi:hypothetical protein
MNGMTMGLRISSWYLCAFKLPSIKCNCVVPLVSYACPSHNPTATMGHSIHNVDISKPLAHTMLCTLSARYSASGHRRWAFCHWSRLRRWTEVRSRP